MTKTLAQIEERMNELRTRVHGPQNELLVGIRVTMLEELKWFVTDEVQKLPETPQRPAPNPNDILAQQLQTLPWKPNRMGEWIFANLKLPQVDALRLLLKDKELAEVGGYVYSMSGKDSKFINRRRSK